MRLWQAFKLNALRACSSLTWVYSTFCYLDLLVLLRSYGPLENKSAYSLALLMLDPWEGQLCFLSQVTSPLPSKHYKLKSKLHEIKDYVWLFHYSSSILDLVLVLSRCSISMCVWINDPLPHTLPVLLLSKSYSCLKKYLKCNIGDESFYKTQVICNMSTFLLFVLPFLL